MPRARRRSRTTLLLATTAVLGLVAGTCTGYLIQADRKPTALPSLSQPTLAQAKGKGPEPLSAAQDHKVKTDGDLRKLLLKQPGGARKALYTAGNDGWLGLADYADTFGKPTGAVRNLIKQEFRRAAVTNWREGSTYNVEIRLVQYRQEENLAAFDAAVDAHFWADKDSAADSWPIPGTGDGMAYVHHTPDSEPGYMDVYRAEAHAWRGDIAMEIWVYDTKPITKNKIMDLAKRQMERL
ncbi:hypothetical protein [Streptomyces brasiliensis]|uniref:Uncharacterized protein n=1 Tax=Streptomyces brasiliensis TaxID=1954 RepID=A0A917L6I6_9ACTN|nr:hypothetical protein [Streptomyces brasiliensis]GGJ44898.1 hypothetical protein GCM10010121_065140 [Streptomyces brasiliensis]